MQTATDFYVFILWETIYHFFTLKKSYSETGCISKAGAIINTKYTECSTLELMQKKSCREHNIFFYHTQQLLKAALTFSGIPQLTSVAIIWSQEKMHFVTGVAESLGNISKHQFVYEIKILHHCSIKTSISILDFRV